MKKLANILLPVLILMHGISLSSNTLTKKELATIQQYLLSVDEDPLQNTFSKRALGKSTSIIYVALADMPLPVSIRYVYFKNGEIAPLNLESLTRVYQEEMQHIVSGKNREEIIRTFVSHHTGEEIAQIETVDDIPNYRNNPLDPDMESSVRKTFQSGEGVYVSYFYQKIGGLVFRYKFKFKESGKLEKVSSLLIGEGIGTPVYYE